MLVIELGISGRIIALSYSIYISFYNVSRAFPLAITVKAQSCWFLSQTFSLNYAGCRKPETGLEKEEKPKLMAVMAQPQSRGGKKQRWTSQSCRQMGLRRQMDALSGLRLAIGWLLQGIFWKAWLPCSGRGCFSEYLCFAVYFAFLSVICLALCPSQLSHPPLHAHYSLLQESHRLCESPWAIIATFLLRSLSLYYSLAIISW